MQIFHDQIRSSFSFEPTPVFFFFFFSSLQPLNVLAHFLDRFLQMSVREQTLPIPSTSLGKCPAFEAEMVDVYASYLHSCSVKQFVLPNTGLNNPRIDRLGRLLPASNSSIRASHCHILWRLVIPSNAIGLIIGETAFSRLIRRHQVRDSML